MVTFNEVCSINKLTHVETVVDFFKLMEVYGAQAELPDLDTLQSSTFIIQARAAALDKITSVY